MAVKQALGTSSRSSFRFSKGHSSSAEVVPKICCSLWCLFVASKSVDCFASPSVFRGCLSIFCSLKRLY
jgi:hypothetical protein